jgi:uncharacterized protein (TIGR02145 family)
MKKVFFVAFILINAIYVNAQVSIGSLANPHAGAVLDLSQSGYSTKQGLLLPNVALENDLTIFKLPLDVGSVKEKMQARGMIVYNTNKIVGEGFYIWDGTKWNGINPAPPIFVEIIGNNFVKSGEKILLAALINPGNLGAKNINWEIKSKNAQVSTASFSTTTVSPTVFTATLVGNASSGTVVISVTAQDNDGNNLYAEKTITVGGINVNFDYEDFGSLGIWMTENLKGKCAYCTNEGIYFSPSEVATACPSGWSVPTKEQWNNLLYFFFEQKHTAERDRFFRNKTELKGACVTYTDPAGTVISNGTDGYWWTKDAKQYAVTTHNYDIVTAPPYYKVSDTTPALSIYQKFTIRCIKN